MKIRGGYRLEKDLIVVMNTNQDSQDVDVLFYIEESHDHTFIISEIWKVIIFEYWHTGFFPRTWG